MENNCWLAPSGECLYTPPSGYYGFVYEILLPDGTIYFGKKAFEHSNKKIISKRARKLSGSKKRVERVKKDSGWLDYWGSSKILLKHIEDNDLLSGGNFKKKSSRRILKLCKDKVSLSYWEMVTLVEQRVLFRNDCWNGNISGRFFKGKIHE